MNSELNKRFKKGFTLAEALITLVIIGIIAALTIPAILVNTEQHEYKSALKKGLNSINYAIEMTLAMDNFTPMETTPMIDTDPDFVEYSLYHILKRRMNVISTSSDYALGGTPNYTFFTADGLRYEFPEDPEFKNTPGDLLATKNARCASTYGTKPAFDEEGNLLDRPCLIVMDVNGDRRPNPSRVSPTEGYKVPKPFSTSRVMDVFPILVTESAAYPYGVVGQRVLFDKNVDVDNPNI